MVAFIDMAIVAGASFAAGAINAVAGGGTLMTFPVLVAVGIPPLTASVTNTVAMGPGYFGAALAQRRDLEGQGRRAAYLLPVAALGGVGGALALLGTGDRAFDKVVPFLVLLAAALVAGQELLRKLLFGRTAPGKVLAWAMLPVGLAGIYGGYFGAGMGVMILAALGIVIADDLLRINALKQVLTLAVSISAGVVFFIAGEIHGTFAAIMAVSSLGGGAFGGFVATRVPAAVLRWFVVSVGVGVAGVFFARW